MLAREVEHPNHDDALVISARIANTRVKRIMVDTGSSANVLYFDAFQKLGLTIKDLTPSQSTLIGFTGDSVLSLGTTTIPVTLGEVPQVKMVMVTFMVVELPSAYNAILGRPTLKKFRAVISIYHRAIKFPTQEGVGEAKSDPRESR